jgi:threonyl-tRNA synthetase
LAQAVQELFPDARLGIGPPIADGFYYDFDVSQPFKPDDLARIETKMRKIIKDGQRFFRRTVSDDEARAELAEEPYKLELIGSRALQARLPRKVLPSRSELTGSRSTTTSSGTARWRGRTCAGGRTSPPRSASLPSH